MGRICFHMKEEYSRLQPGLFTAHWSQTQETEQHSYNTVTTPLQHPQSTFSHPPISIYQRVCYTRKLASLTNRFPCYSRQCAYQAIVHFLKLPGLSFFFIKPIFNSTIRLRLLVLLAFLCRYVFMLIPLCLCVFCVWTSVHCA